MLNLGSKGVLLEIAIVFIVCFTALITMCLEKFTKFFGLSKILAPVQDRGDVAVKPSVHRRNSKQCHGNNNEPQDVSSPEEWPHQYRAASGCSQSPINLSSSKVIFLPPGMQRPLAFNRQYFAQPQSMTILNDGYSLILGTCYTDDYPTLSGGPLNGRYRFNLAQFKWGPTNDEGSEHTINSQRFAMEMQLMHIKGERIYDDIEEAATHRAIMFLGFLFQVTRQDNPYLDALVDHLHSVRSPNTTYPLDPFPLCWLFQPFKSKYYHYEGSITCPPCTEGVEWLIHAEPLCISNRQLNAFRSMMGFGGPMINNSRPVQKLNNRRIQYFM